MKHILNTATKIIVMASPLTTSSPLEARKSAIDGQAVAAVAASPSFVSNLRLPPIPPSTPPLERREIEAHRKELTNQLAWAAALPAVAVPVTRDGQGLPVGVQLVGRRGFDARLLRTARWVVSKVS